MMEILYSDRLVSITKDRIRFNNYYFPIGSKSVEISQIDHVEILIPTILGGKWRIHGSGDLRTWFPRDIRRSRRDRIFIMRLHHKWWRIGFTAEDSAAVIEIFKARNIPLKDRTANQSPEKTA